MFNRHSVVSTISFLYVCLFVRCLSVDSVCNNDGRTACEPPTLSIKEFRESPSLASPATARTARTARTPPGRPPDRLCADAAVGRLARTVVARTPR